MAMDRELARHFLESLFERITVEPSTGRRHLPGAVSAHEVQALRIAIEALGGVPPAGPEVGEPPLTTPANKTTPTEIEATTGTRAASTTPKPELNLNSLRRERPEDDAVLLCLDFGTAMSKAFASVVEDGVVVKHLPLRLGARAQKGALIYPVPSSLWISDDERIYVGPKAVALSLQNPNIGRQRFDSLKRELTQGDPQGTPDQVRLDREINPSVVPLSQGDAITMYLAYLTDLACTELEEVHGRSRYVHRRFALPSWRAERRQWGERMLAEMLARAQIVADTFHGRWEQGIPVVEAKRVLDAVRELPKRPLQLVGNGVAEPLAAGASRLRRDEQTRGLAMVVDVGAGTTDFALFFVAENPEREIFKAWPIKNCSDVLPLAGDALDNALRKVIYESARVETHDPDFRHVNSALGMRIRGLKEDLFRNGSCTFTLTNGGRGTVEKSVFLKRPEVAQFQQRTAEMFDEVLLRIARTFADRLHRGGLSVVLTGGGATLPMIQELATGSRVVHGHRLQRRGLELVPDVFASDAELRVAYPQLAVAIGGALPETLSEGGAIDEMPGLAAGGSWTLDRFQVKGT